MTGISPDQRSCGVPRHLPAALAAIVALTAGSHAWAQEPLPKAEQILKQAVEALGGEGAFAKLHNRVSKGTFEVAAQGLKGPLTVYEAEGNKNYSLVELEGVGKMENGSDGKVYWEKNPAVGPRILEGEEAAFQARQSTFNAIVHWPKLYKKAEVVSVESVDGQPCYKLEMTPPVGSPEKWFVDQKSHLIIRMDLVYRGPMGEIPIQTVFEDYRAVDGVKLAHRVRQRLGGMLEQLITIRSVEHNADIPKDRFDLPPEIRELLSKKSEKP